MVTHKIHMDLCGHEVLQWMDAVQGDINSRTLEISLFQGVLPWQIPENIKVLIRYQAQDGRRGEYDTLPDGTCAWSARENVLLLKLVPHMLALPGTVRMSVCIFSQEKILNTFPLEIRVQKNLDASPGAFREPDHYSYLTDFLPAPDAAQAGQYLRVAEVDENGKVIAVEASTFSGGTAEEAVPQETTHTADLSITGFVRTNGTLSTSSSGLRTDYIPTGNVTKISGNAGFYNGSIAIAFYDADKQFLADISLIGSAFITVAGAVFGEGRFEIDLSGSQYKDAAFFIVSTYRSPSYTYAQTFADDFCQYTKCEQTVSEEKQQYRIRQNSIAFFGDSITSGIGNGNYPALIATVTGASVTNYSKSGATLATGTDATHCIADLVNDYTGSDDIVCISGGLNDYNKAIPLGELTEGYADELDTATVIGALESILRHLLTNHTTAKLYYVITHKAASAETNQNALGLTFADYHDAIVTVLQKYSVPFYDAFADSGFITSAYGAWGESMRNLYTVNADGVHPNEEGYRKYYVYPIIAMMEYK